MPAPVWAASSSETPQSAGFSFSKDVFTIHLNRTFARPRWEMWGSVAAGKTTQMIVVDLPELGDNLSALQTELDGDIETIRQTNPIFKRLLTMKLGTDTLRVVMEVVQPLSGKPFSPRVSQVAGRQVLVRLYGNPATSTQQMGAAKVFTAEDETLSELGKLPVLEDQTTVYPHSSAEKVLVSTVTPPVSGNTNMPDTLKADNQALLKERNQLKVQLLKLQDTLEKARAEITKEKEKTAKLLAEAQKTETPKVAKQAPAPAKSVSSEKSVVLFQELQKTIQQRDELQAQNYSLQAQNKTLSEELLGQRAAVTLVDPTLDPAKMTAIDQNEKLRQALIGVAGKLKAMQDAIDEKDKEIAALKKVKTSTEAAGTKSPVSESKSSLHNKNLKNTPEKTTADKMSDKIYYKPAPQSAEKMKRALLSSIEQKPSQTDAYFKLHDIYLKEKDLTGAERVMNNLLLVDPKNSDAYYELTHVYLMQDQPIKAQATFETFKRLNPLMTSSHPIYQKIERELQQRIP